MASVEPTPPPVPPFPALAGTPAGPPGPPASILSGALSHLPVAELIQFFHLQAYDGVLLVEDPGGRPQAAIYFQERGIVHALCGDLIGKKAVYRSLALGTGRFRFLNGLVPGISRSVRESVPNLLLEGFRRLERTSHLAALLPDDDAPLFVAPEPPQDDIRLTAGEWRVLSLVNGKRSIREIVAASGRERDDVHAILTSLLTADLVAAEQDDSWLDAIHPRVLRSEEAAVQRFTPQTLLSNLLVNKADGRKSLRQLIADLGAEPNVLLDEMRLLVRTRWIGFAAGEAEYARYVGPG